MMYLSLVTSCLDLCLQKLNFFLILVSPFSCCSRTILRKTTPFIGSLVGVAIMAWYAWVFTVVGPDLRGGFDQMFFATHKCNLMCVSNS